MATRREELLRVGAALFAERGFHGVGVDDLGAAAGISGPGVYRHFTSKDALLAELLLRVSQDLLDGGRVCVEACEGNDEAALGALVDAHVTFALDNRAVITVYDRDLGSLPEGPRRRIRRLQREYAEVWVDVVTRLRPGSDGGHDDRTARAAVHAAFGLMNSTPHSARDLDRAEHGQLLHRMATAALLA
ncbi:MAG: TetR/AcrR family transcriptional regulator [Candidatus Nanopelagicales bacterium]